MRDNRSIGVLRAVVGFALMLSAIGFLIEGGFSRYAIFGVPARAAWRIVGLGLIIFGAGVFLFRPNYFLHRKSK
jgi:hypothetical protein